jgi:lambda family phage tail tape measure protein
LLGEAIYNTSSGALNDAVKLITDIANTLTGAVTGANNFGETLKQVSYVIESVLIVAIMKAISNSKALKMSLLSLGGNAVLTAIGTAATALLNIGREQASIYEQAIARQKEFTDQKTLSDTAKPLEIRVEASKSVQDARKQLAELKKELGRVNSTEASIVYVGEERGTIAKEAALEDLNKAISFQKELITKTIDASRLEILKADEEARKAIVLNGVNLEADIAKARENALKAQGKTTEGAIQEFTNTYGDKIEAAKKEIKSLEALAISGTEDQKIYAADKLSKLNQFLADLDTQKAKLIKDANKKVTTPEIPEAYKAALEDVKNTALELQNSVSIALTNIDILYQQNAMSIETYFSQKMQLQETDLAVQKEMLNQELQLAYAQKDKVKIQKLNGELIKAETDANKLATKTIIEKTNATRAYQAMTLEGQAKVLAFQGRGGEAALGQFDVANRDKLEKFKIAGDTAALRNLEIERQNVALKGAIADIDEKRTLQEADYQAALERTNILKNTGAIGEFTALQQITAANEARIASMEEAVRIKELEIAKTEELVGVVDLKERSALKKLREELENFRLTSDAVAQHFDKVFSDSFTNAFTGFANGTMTAKQAFSSLITSMIGEIQKLIAQEMASAALRSVIKPLANWAMSGIGDMFSSGQSAAFTDTFSKSGTDFWGAGATKIWPNANGGVFSGPGISAYSGSIVSKPTIFPFAKGTGLMGEAGPEAILPLTRNSKGKLGVIADSTGQSGSNVYNIAVTVQSSKDEKPADTGQKIAEAMMRTIAKQEIGLAARPGNSLNRTTKFG